MLVKQLYINNPLRNFNYILVCEQTGNAIVIDPLDAKLCLATAKEQQWKITHIVNTHEHWDHIEGNTEIVKTTKAKILAHHNAKIANVDQGLHAGDSITVGDTVKLNVLDTPGHTMTHVCLLSKEPEPAIFSGDTLFNAGCGNCINGGDPHVLFKTFDQQLFKLPDNTKIYPGHDYIINNLNFSLAREPENKNAQALLESLKDYDPFHPYLSTIGLEREINPFFRLESPHIIKNLVHDLPMLPENPSTEEVFVGLRTLRNQW